MKMRKRHILAARLGATFPNMVVDTTQGKFRLHDYQGNSWLVFLSYPADFTAVSTTELVRAINMIAEFRRRNAKLIALSCNPVDDHKAWLLDVMALCKQPGELPFPVIADPSRDVAIRLGILDSFATDAAGLPLTCRAVFLVDPNKSLRLSTLYPYSTGRNFNEILRTIDAVQVSASKAIDTPVNWNKGGKVIVPPTAEAAKYPNPVETVGLPSGKNYMRYTTV